ncbi:hypothetical protein ABZW18_21125 [Streptomyces sp. NPDC004647]|uniref:hypothetical protein n=1 Tax=Streptomyces sp. NPDC004647 TaxID=3154671 RepID=UPI0033B20FF0
MLPRSTFAACPPPTLTAARLQTGGQAYRDFLAVGSATIANALHTARRAADGAERLRMREALDALERHHDHEVPAWVVVTTANLDTHPDAEFTPEARSYRRRALEEHRVRRQSQESPTVSSRMSSMVTMMAVLPGLEAPAAGSVTDGSLTD